MDRISSHLDLMKGMRGGIVEADGVEILKYGMSSEG
jgi:hypothetical protein